LRSNLVESRYPPRLLQGVLRSQQRGTPIDHGVTKRVTGAKVTRRMAVVVSIQRILLQLHALHQTPWLRTVGTASRTASTQVLHTKQTGTWSSRILARSVLILQTKQSSTHTTQTHLASVPKLLPWNSTMAPAIAPSFNF